MGILNAFLLNFTNAFMSSASSILASKFSLISFRKYGDTLSMFSFFYLKKIVFLFKKKKKGRKKTATNFEPWSESRKSEQRGWFSYIKWVLGWLFSWAWYKHNLKDPAIFRSWILNKVSELTPKFQFFWGTYFYLSNQDLAKKDSQTRFANFD